MGYIHNYTCSIYQQVLTFSEQDAYDYFIERISSSEEQKDSSLRGLSFYALSFLFYNLSMYYDSLKSLKNAISCFEDDSTSCPAKEDLLAFFQLELVFLFCCLRKLDSISSLPEPLIKQCSENPELHQHYILLMARVSACTDDMPSCKRYSTELLKLREHALSFRDFNEYELLFEYFLLHNEFAFAEAFLSEIEYFASQTVLQSLQLLYWSAALEFWQATGNTKEWNKHFGQYEKLSRQRQEHVLKSLQSDITNKDLIFHQVDLKMKMMHRVEQLKEKAELDTLTKLPNRYKINEYALQAFHAAQEKGEHLGLMLIDIDNFKQYNDRFGHLTGDQCLTLVANNLQRLAGDNFVSRYGGDEFLAIFEGCELQTILDFAEDLNLALRDVTGISGEQLSPGSLTVSQGIVYSVPDELHSWSDFLNAADLQLYHGKKKGKNQICIITHL